MNDARTPPLPNAEGISRRRLVATVPELLRHAAAEHPGRIAVTEGRRNIEYRALWNATRRLARAFDDLALARGARVLLFLNNSIEYVIAYFAVVHRGMVVVPMDRLEHPTVIGRLAAECEAEAIICARALQPRLPLILESGARPRVIISDHPLSGSYGETTVTCLDEILHTDGSTTTAANPSESPTAAGPPGEEPSDALAAIFYTSGSTGTPKGVMLSHRNLISNTDATVDYLGLRADDSVMVVLPFHYSYGNSLLLTHVATGGRLVIDPRFLYPEAILDAMESERVTGFAGVPFHFTVMLGKTSFTRRALPDLRYIAQAGGALAPHLIEKMAEAFPTKQIFVMYGLTEASPRVTWLPPDRLTDKLGTIGIPIPGVEVTIADDEGNPVPDCDTGEIVVSGDGVMMGYWRQPEETARVIRDGCLRTGDLGRRDGDGFLQVVGRVKEMIKSGGNRVGAKEVEECLLRHDDVLEAAVIGVADEVLGEAVKAVIVPKPDAALSVDAVLAHCRKHLAAHKVPKHVVLVGALPKHPTGKVNRPLILEQHA